MTNLPAEITAGQQRFDNTAQNIQTQVDSNLESNTGKNWSPPVYLKLRCIRREEELVSTGHMCA